jgi:serine/threonine protein kinase
LESVRDELDNIQKEISLLSRLDSVYVVQYLGSFLHGTHLNVVMEYMSGGSLRDLMKAGPLHEGEISAILREVLSGLTFLHGANVVHRDIKAANILMSETGKVKIADFGVARELNATKRKFSVVGSPYWMAPEVITAKEGGLYNEKADIWSLGITAIELAKGYPPRSSEKPMKVLVSIPTSPPPKLEGSFSSSFKDFVATCLKLNPSDRPSAKELLNHPFISQSKDTSLVLQISQRYKAWAASQPQTSSSSSSSLSSFSLESHIGSTKHHTTSAIAIPSAGVGEKSSSKRGAFKKTSIDKFKAANPIEASVSDSIDDWDLSSNTRTGSPSESVKDSDSDAANSPRGGFLPGSGKHTMKATGSGKFGDFKERPPPSSIGLRRPVEFSTLSASTDENQFGSVIVHQTADSEASSSYTRSSELKESAPGLNDGAGEEEDEMSASMTEQQFGSVVIKSVKKKPDLSSFEQHVNSTSTSTAPISASATTDKKKDKKTSSSSSSTAGAGNGLSSTVGARPKSALEDLASAPDPKSLKRDKSKSKIDSPTKGSVGGDAITASSAAIVETVDTATSVRRPKSIDRTPQPQHGSASSPSLKDRTDKKKDKDSTAVGRTKRKKVVTAAPSTNTAPSSPESSPSDSHTILNQVLLPTLAKKQGSSDKVASLISTFSALETEIPGFTSDFVLGIIRSFEKEQKSLPSIGVQMVLNSTREEYSDLTKYLLSRWKSRTELPTPSRDTNDDSYFL